MTHTKARRHEGFEKRKKQRGHSTLLRVLFAVTAKTKRGTGAADGASPLFEKTRDHLRAVEDLIHGERKIPLVKG